MIGTKAIPYLPGVHRSRLALVRENTARLLNFALSLLALGIAGCGFFSASIESGGTTASSSTAPYAACTDDILNPGQCSTATNRFVTATNGGDVTGANGSLTASIPTGFYTGRACTMSDTNLIAGNIRKDINIFGVTGTFTVTFAENTASNALRDPGSIPVPSHLDIQTTSNQISLKEENTTYAGANLPTSGGFNYRAIPDQNSTRAERGPFQHLSLVSI